MARRAVAMRSLEIDMNEYPRGEILDRNGLALTSSRKSWAVYYRLGAIKGCLDGQHPETDARKVYQELLVPLTEYLAVSREEVFNKLRMAANRGAYYVRIANRLTESQAQKIESLRLSGVVVAPMTERYRDDGFCSHLLGYVSTNSSGDGLAGIEKEYDHILKEYNNPELRTGIDARGETIPGLQRKMKYQDAKKSVVVLTVDRRVQEIVEKAMNEMVSTGAVVVMDVKSKDILAMASRPAFNPYEVAKIIDSDDSEHALINRALNLYYPGSLFKLVLSIAAFQNQAVDLDEKFDCNGKYQFNDELSIACWKEEGHGRINFAQAFAYSCNPSFIEIGLRLGRHKLLNCVNSLHLTEPKINGLKSDLLTGSVKIDGGDAAMGNACLGQQGVKLSPVQIASLFATIADNGMWAPPSLLLYTIDDQGHKELISRSKKERLISKDTASQMQELLGKVVEYGTGKTAAISETRVAGKTGTSETGNKNSEGEEILNTWFAGYLPANEPRWVIVVLVEDGSSGAHDSIPVFRAISQNMLKYFSLSA